MVSRGKAILDILRRTTFTPETIQQIIVKPLPPPHLTYPHLYYKPFTRYAAEREGTFDKAWEPQQFPFVPDRLPQLPEIQEPAIRERVFTHLSARTNGATRGCTHGQWMGSYKRYEGLGDVVINHAAWLAAEKSRTKDFHAVATKLLSNNTLSYLAYSYQMHHELRHFLRDMPQPPQKVFADIFEAYVGAAYVEAESRGEEDSVFEWLSRLFDPLNWPEWPSGVDPEWKERYATVDTAALHRMLRTIIKRPSSRGVPIIRLPRRVGLAEEGVVQTRTSGRASRWTRGRKLGRAEKSARGTTASTVKANPYKALLLARRASQESMLREEQRLAGMIQPSGPPPSPTAGSIKALNSSPSAAKGTAAAAPTPPCASPPSANLVLVRAGPPPLPEAWLHKKMARVRAANRTRK